MKIAFVLYTSGSVSGGSAKHFRILPPLVAADPRVEELRLFVPEGAVNDCSADLPVFEWPAGNRRAGDAALRRALAEYDPDVVFIPSARFIETPDTPTVVMVRNMEPLLTPFGGNRLIDRVKNIARRVVAERACRKADRIIAVSSHVRDFLIDSWNLEGDRIGTVYHGVEPPPCPRRHDNLAALGDRPFLFSMGSIRPARGLTDLIEAMADPRIPRELQLVFAGTADVGAEHYRDRVIALAERLGLQNRIHWAGQFDPAEVSWCFRNARVFVMTSRAEACPNTVLEALSHGSFSVSGDNAPMPEFFQDSAIYYRNGDGRSLAEALVCALETNAADEAALRARARQRAANFTWELCAERTVNELEHAIRLRNRR